MIIKKEQAEKFIIPGGTEGVLYPPSPRRDQSIAIVEMDGIYPEKGFSINDFCTETIFMLEGELEVEIEGKTYIIKPGDMAVIEPLNKYRVRGKGKSIDLITPAWDKAQNHIIN